MRRRKKGAAFFLAVAVTVFLGTSGTLEQMAVLEKPDAYVGAWWGCLYPRFCFMEKEEGEEFHLSFWVAQVLDWW